MPGLPPSVPRAERQAKAATLIPTSKAVDGSGITSITPIWRSNESMMTPNGCVRTTFLSAIAEARELPGLVHEYREVRAQGDRRSAVWVVLARKPAALSLLQVDPGWRPLSTAAPGPLWTDTYSSLVGVLRDGLLSNRLR